VPGLRPADLRRPRAPVAVHEGLERVDEEPHIGLAARGDVAAGLVPRRVLGDELGAPPTPPLAGRARSSPGRCWGSAGWWR
jgi:hypothetical protein